MDRKHKTTRKKITIIKQLINILEGVEKGEIGTGWLTKEQKNDLLEKIKNNRHKCLDMEME